MWSEFEETMPTDSTTRQINRTELAVSGQTASAKWRDRDLLQITQQSN